MTEPARKTHKSFRPRLFGSPLALGVLLLVVTVLGSAFLFERERIVSWVQPGVVMDIHFAQNYRLRALDSEVKVAGVPVGIVRSVDQEDDGSALVKVKVDQDAAEKLGATPSAAIRPTTMLGGKYYVELIPGGQRGQLPASIPAQRTTLPVELQQLAETLQPDVVKGLRSSTRQFDLTLHNDGQQAIDQLLADGPGTLGPATATLQGLQGTQPSVDLPKLVDGLEATGRVLNDREVELGATVHSISQTTGALGHRGPDVGRFFGQLPSTLDSADYGLRRLDVTLAKLRDTADSDRPIAREFSTTLKHLDPVLDRSVPVLADLRDVVRDARPLMSDLDPSVPRIDETLHNLRGPVLDRISGPFMRMYLNPFKGTGHYSGSGSDKPFYEELAYMFTTLDRASMTTDANGVGVRLQPGFGGPSPEGTPGESLGNLLGHLSGGTPEQRGAHR